MYYSTHSLFCEHEKSGFVNTKAIKTRTRYYNIIMHAYTQSLLTFIPTIPTNIL